MSTPVLCAVVGVGYLGRFHAQKYKKVDGGQLAFVCDSSSENAQRVGEELQVPFLTDYRQLVGKVQAVAVAASTPAHYEIVKYMLEHDIHVFVEKPLTVTSREGEELVKLARSKKLKLQVGHVERFNPALQAAQKQLMKPLFIESHRLAPFKVRSMEVSVILDLMIHDIDVVLSLVKSPVKSLSAVGTPVITKEIDIANARLEFESGAVANITASRVSLQTQRKIRVFQANQYLSIDFGSGDVQMVTKTGDLVVTPTGEPDLPMEIESWNMEKGDALLAEAQSFVDAIRYDRECVVTGEDGLLALKIAEQITEQIWNKVKSV